jgi:hypothetical protein
MRGWTFSRIAPPLAMSLTLMAAACGGSRRPPAAATEPAADAAPPAPVDATEAVALLHQYVGSFNSGALMGSFDEVLHGLDDLSRRARDDAARGTITEAFHRRYEHLLHVSGLVFETTPSPAREAARAELQAFVDKVEGGHHPVDADGGLAAVADALAEEVVSLHLMATGTTDRNAARTLYHFGY